MSDLTVGGLASLLTMAGMLATALLLLFNLWYRFGKLERQAAHRQEDTEMSFKCHRACLVGLIESGADGAVKAALGELNDYMAKKASGARTPDK